MRSSVGLVGVMLLGACAGVRPAEWKPTPLAANGRAVRCTADTLRLCAKHVVLLEESDCRAHVTTYDACTGRTTEDVFNVPFCGSVIDRFVTKQQGEGSIDCAMADGTYWTEETTDAHGALASRTVQPDETAEVGLACLELFKLSRRSMRLQTNEGEFARCRSQKPPDHN